MYRYLNLQTFAVLEQADEPALCWAFSKRETLEGPAEDYFLVSYADAPAAREPVAGMLARGEAVDFHAARKALKNLLEGKTAAGAISRVATHLRATSGLTSAEALAAEREAFAAQFDAPEPRQGLEGFLRKNKAPFEPPASTADGLRALLRWMESG